MVPVKWVNTFWYISLHFKHVLLKSDVGESEADICALAALRSMSFLCQSNAVSAPTSATVYARCRGIIWRGGRGCGGLPCGLKSSHDWCMHLGTSDKLEPLLPLQCPGGRQAASWAPGTVRGSRLFAGGREGERGRSCVQRERCRLLDLVSSRVPLTHDRQGALCSTPIETGWNNKAQIAFLCLFWVFF